MAFMRGTPLQPRVVLSCEGSSGLLCWLYTVRLLRSHAACEPGGLLVTLQASSGSAGMLLKVQDSQCVSGV